MSRLENAESPFGPEAGEKESSPDRRPSIEPAGFFDQREGVTIIYANEISGFRQEKIFRSRYLKNLKKIISTR